MNILNWKCFRNPFNPKDSHLKKWLVELGTPLLTHRILDGLDRAMLFLIITFVSGCLPSDKKLAMLGSNVNMKHTMYLFVDDYLLAQPPCYHYNCMLDLPHFLHSYQLEDVLWTTL